MNYKYINDKRWDHGELKNPGADPIILQFIEEVNSHSVYSIDCDEKIKEAQHRAVHDLFRCGYCFYFAHMLKIAFPDGEVCWCAPYGHIVFVKDNIPYDIEGVYNGEAEYFIPEIYLVDCIKDFLHIPGKSHITEQTEIDKIIKNYLQDIK